MNTYIQNKLDEFDDNKFFKILNIPTDKVYAEKDGLRFDLQEINIKEIIEQAITEAYNKGQTDYHNHTVERIEKSINNWKVEIGEIPENTCPKIDKLIGQHKEILNDLNYLEKNKHKYETVDDIVKDFPGTYWDNVESIAEELRVSNEKLREIGKFWYENCKSIPPLLQDTNPKE